MYDIELKHAPIARSDIKRVILILLLICSPTLYLAGKWVFRERGPEIPGSIEGFLNLSITDPTLILTIGDDSAEAVQYLKRLGFVALHPEFTGRGSVIYSLDEVVKLGFGCTDGRVSGINLQIKYPNRQELLDQLREWQEPLWATHFSRDGYTFYRRVAPRTYYVFYFDDVNSTWAQLNLFRKRTKLRQPNSAEDES